MGVITKKAGRRRAAAKPQPPFRCDVLKRGPNWLFLHVEHASAEPDLAERLWGIARRHLTTRLVLELDSAEPIDSRLSAELRELCRRLNAVDGKLRLCGLPPASADELIAEVGCPALRHEDSLRDAAVSDSVILSAPPAANKPR